jgi:hypothetical protein
VGGESSAALQQFVTVYDETAGTVTISF